MTDPAPGPLISIRGDATEEEVAAVVAVLQIAAAAQQAAAAGRTRPRRVSTWASPGRQVRQTLPHGPGGWRSSALPR